MNKLLLALVTSSLLGLLCSCDQGGIYPQEIRISEEEQDKIIRVQVSPNENYYLTEDDGNKARLWDVATGVQRFVFPHTTSDTATVQFSPDSSKLVTRVEVSSLNYELHLWDVKSGKEIGSPISGYSLSFSQNGLFYLVVRQGHRDLLEASTGNLISTFQSDAVMSSDHNMVVGTEGSQISTWDVSSEAAQKKLALPYNGMGVKATYLSALSPDQKELVVHAQKSDDTYETSLWRREDGVQMARQMGILTTTFSTDGRTMIWQKDPFSLSPQQSSFWWVNTEDGSIIANWDSPDHFLGFSADGNQMFFWNPVHQREKWENRDDDYTLYLYNPKTKEKTVAATSFGYMVPFPLIDQDRVIVAESYASFFVKITGLKQSVEAGALWIFSEGKEPTRLTRLLVWPPDNFHNGRNDFSCNRVTPGQPLAGGTKFVAICDDGVVRVWDLQGI